MPTHFSQRDALVLRDVANLSSGGAGCVNRARPDLQGPEVGNHPGLPTWTKRGAHLLLQTRVKTLNCELASVFQRWYPDMQVEEVTEAV
jgi:hypothetical protein